MEPWGTAAWEVKGGATGKDGWGAASGQEENKESGSWKKWHVGGVSDKWGWDSDPDTAVDAALTEWKGKNTNSRMTQRLSYSIYLLFMGMYIRYVWTRLSYSIKIIITQLMSRY